MKGKNQKLKLFTLNRILEEHTDDKHGLKMSRILDLLREHGIDAERKSIREDIEALQTLGVDVGTEGENAKLYKLFSREFELFEIKLLVDSIQTSKFLPQDKTNALVKKLMKLCSMHERRTLERQVIVSNRAKNLNTRIHYSMDKIHLAIAENKQISFKYFDYDIEKKRIYRKKGENYHLSPFAMIYTDDNYYLLAFDADKEEVRPFRVDRMESVNILKADRLGHEAYKAIDMSRYTNYTFSMYGGEIEHVTLQFQNRLMNAVIDRFGTDIHPRKVDKSHFEITVPVAVSQQFFGWLFGLGKMVRIVGPESVRQQMQKALLDLGARYEEEAQQEQGQ